MAASEVQKSNAAHAEHHSKKRKLMFDEDSSDDSSGSSISDEEEANGEEEEPAFKVNEEYARRFEHNKKREEMHRLEEKHGKVKLARASSPNASDESGSSELDGSSSSSEDEDDEGELVTRDLDEQIAATLDAIRSKDPRVYDKNVTFYADGNGEQTESNQKKVSKEKPMYLRDYHRMNLLKGQALGDDQDEMSGKIKTYAQEQDELKRGIVQAMHSAVDDADADSESGDEMNDADAEDTFFTAKPRPVNGETEKSKPTPFADSDEVLALADKAPDQFLSNYMASRAWVPRDHTGLVPFESDDDEEEQRAEEFEQAFNLRFEDPAASNEKLISHARDAVAKYSVRRSELSGRKKARESQRERKEAEKRELEQEKARLRKLKIEESEQKLRKIKEAAGLFREELKEEDWLPFLNDAWDMEQWESEMHRRFGDAYYAAKENDGKGAGYALNEKGRRTKKKLQKPTWSDDIDISDLVPDFENGRGAAPEKGQGSADEAEDAAEEEEEGVELDPEVEDGEEDDADDHPTSQRTRKKQQIQQRREQQKVARRERLAIEGMVDEKLQFVEPLTSGPAASAGPFRYRETSPTAYGLTPADIFLASDSQLNQFIGLKRLAPFRDPRKKQRDRKALGRKARLRKWRRETFGTKQPPDFHSRYGKRALEALDAEEHGRPPPAPISANVAKKRARQRKAKRMKVTA
ncbi:MAG: hypothetical protein M1823_005434 [Watsoniomyces obsoletus]|nr:MAG: hypothetical protein M1823_005434 [Watsoniomyces obsoletus]